ncbi:hypothetical protein BMS80_09185, partial [Leuconostoc pseudomesenteroides]
MRAIPRFLAPSILKSSQRGKFAPEPYKAYGAPRLRLALADLNLHHGTNRVRRLMREAGIYSVMTRRFNKPTTTVDYRQRPNLIRHLPEANAWSMDITYLKLSNGQWVYLASVLEL